MLRDRYSVPLPFFVAVILGFVVGCPNVGAPVGGDDGAANGNPPAGQGSALGFAERWESVSLATNIPAQPREGVGIFEGDAGSWILGDTASGDPDCSPSPHTAEIISHRGSNAIRLTSNETDCADNMWIQFINESIVDNALNIPLSRSTQLSFYEEGALRNPESTSSCGWYRCETKLEIEDTRGNLVVYILQRSAGRRKAAPFFSVEIPLDSSAGLHQRNLFDDFSLIPRFNPSGARIRAVSLSLDTLGWAILDDLVIAGNGEIVDSEDGVSDPDAGHETIDCRRLITSLDDTYLRVENTLDSHIEVHVSNLHMTVGPVIDYAAVVYANSCNRLGLAGYTTVDVTLKKCDSGDFDEFGSSVPCGFGFPRKTIQITPAPGVTTTLEVTEAFFSN